MSLSKSAFLLLTVCLFCTGETLAQSSADLKTQDWSGKYASADTVFKSSFIDIDEWREQPVRHRYVHGGFKGTETRFSLYFPEPGAYQGRFFQYITPFPDNENLSQGAKGEEDKIGFSIASGAYFIETNGGGHIDFSKPMMASDPTIGAYRANAATARFSRTVAAVLYGPHRTYGYCFGGSGGAYRTIGGLENAPGAWDGAVPYVLGSPMAIPNVFSVRMHAMRILNDRMPAIIDAFEPGGSGNPYAGLNEEESAALREVTRMGFPPKSWFGYRTMGVHGFIALYQGMVMADRKYFDDFWTVKGYLGANPTASLLKARLKQASKIKGGIPLDDAVRFGLREPASESERGTADAAWKSIAGATGQLPVAFQLEDQLPDVNFLGGDLLIRSGAAAGKTLQLVKVLGDKVLLGPADPALLALIKPGDEVTVDNSNFLASQTYHRHQVPGKEYRVWDQFRDSLGKPIYPQRPMLLGPLFTQSASGVLPKGRFEGKMILLCSLWDREAFPWQGDWYRSRVNEYLGDKTNDNFRLWYTDHALHGDLSIQEDPTRTVSYLGVLQQALRDLSQWVEKGKAPAATTQYRIVDGQVIVPPTGQERLGIQPVADLQVEGKKRVDVKVGKALKFRARVTLPPNSGKLVAAEFDFDGSGKFTVPRTMKTVDAQTVVVESGYNFGKAGTYFPTIRVVSQRDGDGKSPYARVQNLDRVRVVVK